MSCRYGTYGKISADNAVQRANGYHVEFIPQPMPRAVWCPFCTHSLMRPVGHGSMQCENKWCQAIVPVGHVGKAA